MFVSVAVPVPLQGFLTYRLPRGEVAVRGVRVVVPLGRRFVTGLVVATHDTTPPIDVAALRDVTRVLDTEPFLPTAIVDLAEWMSDYYLCAPGDTLAAAMPPLAWIESERTWTIVPGCAPGDGGSALERAVLSSLAGEQTFTSAELVRAMSGTAGTVTTAQVERALKRLEALGAIAASERLVGRADASKMERTAALTPAGRDARSLAALTEKQRDALEAIWDLEQLDERAPSVSTLADEQAVSPAVLKALVQKGFVELGTRAVDRGAESRAKDVSDATLSAATVPELELTPEQNTALVELSELADTKAFRVALLHGVTGSGKTEVYRRLARHVRDQQRQILILVPEIALTPAVAARFRAGFGHRVAVLHSALSNGERYDEWRRIRRGDVDVVIGTRSAVFAPLEHLGLVIVDEEHDTSYKQEEAPRYHGRDVALVRARAAGALVVLGSATPSLESYQNALSERFSLHRLTRRVLDRPLADVRIVNMRDELAEAGPEVVLSAALREAVAARLAEGEQAIILLNRRGYAANVFCRQCGDTFDCPNCSVSLTVHKRARRARCHYCDYNARLPETCTKCGAAYLEYQGVGTERVEAEVQALFPAARVARVDRDTVRRRGEITRVLRAFGRRDIDVLVGTQMIAKGHDFPAVTLVGVVSADVGLGLADFRAAERTFQLLTQVAGRAGRGERAGEAIIQTLFPDHYSIQL
ncbi:MAG: primosomal protein N', partial [Vicinamibacterales bacterium]